MSASDSGLVLIAIAVVAGVLLVAGLLLKGERFQMIQSATGKAVSVKRGFSFTYFFFGPFVPLFRGHIAGFFLTLLVELCSCGLARLILLFCYNGIYINWLANHGYHREGYEQTGGNINVEVHVEREQSKGNNGEIEQYKSCTGTIKPVAGLVELADGQDDQTVDLTTGKIEALSGCYKGAVMELQVKESILVGRDEKVCSLVIKEKEISRKHCEIFYNYFEKCFYVTDYSVNGVYLDNGYQLEREKPTPLMPETKIRLGDTQNVFLLKV